LTHFAIWLSRSSTVSSAWCRFSANSRTRSAGVWTAHYCRLPLGPQTSPCDHQSIGEQKQPLTRFHFIVNPPRGVEVKHSDALIGKVLFQLPNVPLGLS
jgi:hypothetical protein